MLRRPLLFVTAAFAAAVFIAYYMGIIAVVFISVGILSAALLFTIRVASSAVQSGASVRRIKVYWLVFLAFAGGTADFAVADMKPDSALELLNDRGQEMNGVISADLCLTGRVRDISKGISGGGDHYIQVLMDWKDSKILVRCYKELPGNLMPGDSITVSGRLQEPAARRNPNSFDYRLYLRSRGIRTTMTAQMIRLGKRDEGGKPEPVTRRLYTVKSGFIDFLEERSGTETAAFMQAIMFGDKGELDEETVEAFRKNGTAHILAVSGLHIGIIYAFLMKLWGMIPIIGRRKSMGFMVFIGAFFGCYMIMSSFSPSVVRAVCMVMLHVLAKIREKRYDLNSAAFLVMNGVLAYNPFMLFNTGFQMSFLAVLTMALILPYVKKVYSGMLLGSIAVQMGLGPFVLYNFNYLSLLAVFINIPVIFMAGIIVPVGLCDMVLVQFSDGGAGAFAGLLTQCLEGLCMIIRDLNSTVATDGFTVFRLASPDIRFIAAYYLSMIVIFSEEGRLAIMRAGKGFRFRRIAKSLLIVMMASAMVGAFTDDGFRSLPVIFIDVGQGDSILVRTEGKGLYRGESYLIDGGGSDNYNLGRKTLAPVLLKNGLSHIDGAFVTHLHTDHYRGICELAREGMIKRLYVYEGNRSREAEVMRDTGLEADQIYYLTAGDRIKLGARTKISILWPVRKTEAEYSRLAADDDNENATSLVMLIENKGVKIMTTGDMDEDGEKQMIAECARGTGLSEALHTDILKAGHHGSKSSTSDMLLDYAKPEISVIQVGRNTYGHPTEELLQRLRLRRIQVYRNDIHGAVGIDIEDGRIKKVISICGNP